MADPDDDRAADKAGKDTLRFRGSRVASGNDIDRPVLPYDPSKAGRKARAADPRYRHARRALERAQAFYGKRPTTLRGLTKQTT